MFRIVCAATGPCVHRLPGGETGIRRIWIRLLQDVLADNPVIERATDLLPFKFIQWYGKVIRETTGLRTCDHIPSLEFGETKP